MCRRARSVPEQSRGGLRSPRGWKGGRLAPRVETPTRRTNRSRARYRSRDPGRGDKPEGGRLPPARSETQPAAPPTGGPSAVPEGAPGGRGGRAPFLLSGGDAGLEGGVQG